MHTPLASTYSLVCIYIYIIYESTLVLYMHLHTSYISSLVFGMHTSYELVEYIIYASVFFMLLESMHTN